MPKANNKKAIQNIAVLSVLTALIIIMSFTPIGYLKIGIVSITFIPIPVVIGAIFGGPAAGAFLGTVFGATSFIQCFGMDAFGAALFSISPFMTAILCFIPRILMGLLCGLIFSVLSKRMQNSAVNYAITSTLGGILNTILFVTLLIVLFKKSGALQEIGDSVHTIITSLITVNAVIEWIACFVIGSAVSKALSSVMKKR